MPMHTHRLITIGVFDSHTHYSLSLFLTPFVILGSADPLGISTAAKVVKTGSWVSHPSYS